ncbi:DNA repair and recombination protein [Wickerhamomyces ciferrii]|uniref:DNA helicase n=1 Tax=Wickerhamomyces ciferrii (strain ATCC 14091 / BCRC 22168 / CBS 111 / JCM 3599 / NBRC 0793 / NRRL Y-1031 F-60-10) TaxID=1206466 RepID=K0KTX0_WICCF|nr:DNA repair and recombination protein [Wickerhamomyces ciferrii]CCH44834.1 DNA repair and recombination protein [Wickerhamomyces ciferrii]
MGRLPKKPTSELGTGAGINAVRRPRAMTDSSSTLSKPFKVPFKTRSSAISSGGKPVRSARLKGPESYAMMSVEDDKENNDMVDIDGQTIMKRKNALSLRRLITDNNYGSTMETTLRRSFTSPLASKPNAANILPPPPLGTKRKPIMVPRPLHDPSDESAIVLYDPTVEKIISDDDLEALDKAIAEAKARDEGKTLECSIELEERPSKRRNVHKSLNEILGITKNPEDEGKKFPDVPVIIDPKLTKILRPHQVEGVKFLYRCVSGLVDPRAKGCIMADEMGLGKTLQCIALMWTLLKQGPRGKKTIDKCIVVCPSSLVRNWANELTKWLGEGAPTPLAIDGKSTKPNEVGSSIQQWSLAKGRNVVRPVLIISYETLRRNVENLKNTEIGLLLADEGHRLKNGDSLTFTSLDSLNCKRRVILSGTPIQNDLSEYFALLNFANPGLLGTRIEFRKNFEIPILKGRDADATDKEVEDGQKKLGMLSTIVSKFIIRRTNDILSKYLPCKYEHVIFVNLSPMQEKLYHHFITSPDIKKLLKGVGSQPLKAIGLLKKLCNHPDLINLDEDFEGSDHLIPDDYINSITGGGRNREVQTWQSGKFSILERFLAKIKKESNDKIVLISNYTQTLDLIEKMCRHNHYGNLRLDGTMNINKRQKLVDRFNDPESPEFIFLLSSKAGGCGINLIGANRLILIDPDWNPASDQQALARVWRDGQKKDCFIYRFITTGSIEEKIFQRQSMKMSLSSCVVDENQDVERLFSTDNLRQLFQFNKNTICDTHDTFHCKRCKKEDGKQTIRSDVMLYGDATTWNHINHKGLKMTNDHLLKNEFEFNEISYVFQYISHV